MAQERQHRTGSPSGPNTNAGGNQRGAAYPESVERLIEELARLPGIGRRSAERLAFHVLKTDTNEVMGLATAIRDVKQRVRHCSVCYNLADDDPCAICAAPNRDPAVVMVVEQPKDLISIEQTGMFNGIFHVLMGRISPLDGVGPEDITIAELLDRIDNPAANARQEPVKEVVLALNPTLEGDGTTLHLARELETRQVSVTRLARGLPTGSQLEYASKAVLADAIDGRKPMT